MVGGVNVVLLRVGRKYFITQAPTNPSMYRHNNVRGERKREHVFLERSDE